MHFVLSPWLIVLVCILLFPLQTSALVISLDEQQQVVIEPFQPGTGECKTCHLKGVLHIEKIHLDFQLFYKAPESMRLEIRDSRDRTPILIATEGKLMFYDPVALEVLYGEFLAGIKLEVKSNPERKVELNFVFTHVETKQKMADKLASIVLIDIPAILELVVQPWTIKTNNQKDFVLSGTTTNEGIVEMYLEPGRQFGPLKKINFSRKDVNQGIPFLRIDQYNMNIPLDDQIFTFPTTVMKNVDLPIKELGKLLSVQAMYSKMQYARALMSRFLLADRENAESRKLLEKLYLGKVDWQKVVETDLQLSKKLREIFREEIQVKK